MPAAQACLSARLATHRRRVERIEPRASARLLGMTRYDGDVLSGGWRQPRALPELAATTDLVVEDAETGFCGAV